MVNRSYQYRGRSMPRMTYPACPIDNCGTDRAESREVLCDGMVLAMSYVLMQNFEDLYEPDNGYHRGTVFAQLDKPFMAGGVACE